MLRCVLHFLGWSLVMADIVNVNNINVSQPDIDLTS